MISSRALLSLLDADLQSATCDPEIGQTQEILDCLKDRMRNSLAKKLKFARTESCATAAIESFLACNNQCRDFILTPEPLHAYQSDILHRALPELDWDLVFLNADMGPGASVYSCGRNSTFEKLFCNKITTTSYGLYVEYMRFLKHFPSLFIAEQLRNDLWSGVLSVELVDGSSLSTVPKNDQTDRVICTEPSLNMYAQKGLGNIISDTLRSRWGYSKSKQPGRNARLARIGSRDGTFATIDLKNASDTISIDLVKALLPSTWFAAIMDSRSPKTKINGNYVDLHMISSMGNGFTFQLMTLILTSAIEAILQMKGVKGHVTFGVFGDDIVIPSELWHDVIPYLQRLGFTINLEKSFNEGHFRESCGGDWFDGYNVRGVYIKSLDSDQQKLVAINRLHEWSALHQIRLPKLIRAIYTSLEKKPPFVPFDEADDAGLKVPAILVASCRYRAYKPMAKKFVVGFHRLVDGEKIFELKASHQNLVGYLYSSIEGWVRNGSVTRRSDPPVYKLERCFTTRWNFIPAKPHCRKVSVRDWWKVLVAP